MRFKVLMAVNIKIMVFWDMIPYSLLNRNQHFGGHTDSIFRVEARGVVT
jgi:hypothetical protein